MQYLVRAKTWLLAAALFLLPWQTNLFLHAATLGGVESPFTEAKLFLVEALVLVAASASVVALVIACVRTKRFPAIPRVYWLPLLFGACVLLLSLHVAPCEFDEAVSAGANSAACAPYHGMSMIAHLAIAALLFVLLLDRRVPTKPLLLAFGAGLLAPSLLGFWQVLVDSSPASTILGLAGRDAATLGDAIVVDDGVRELRAYGSFSHPNVFGGYLAVGIIALRALLSDKGGERMRRFVSIGMLVLIAALVFTASRSAILGLFLGVGLSALVAHMKNTKVARILVVPIAIVVIGGALAATLVAPEVVASVRGGGPTEDLSVIERRIQYETYAEATGGSWLFGNGVGSYVFVIAEIGVIGALAVFAWSSSIDRVNFARFPNRDALMAFAMGNVVLVALFFDHYIWSSWAGLALIAFVMAMTLRLGEKA
ncbi:hypothetical protein HYS28_01290 [Candidatus Uhrbacteria bacterium]|nr:hypothetical protein [Candidatus Uhrbacteria bacterium]